MIMFSYGNIIYIVLINIILEELWVLVGRLICDNGESFWFVKFCSENGLVNCYMLMVGNCFFNNIFFNVYVFV